MQASVTKAQLSTPARRLGGYLLDVLYSVIATFMMMLVAPSGQGAGPGVLPLLAIAYLLIGLWFWSQGTSPGKMTLGMYVYGKESGERLGFWSMLVREVIGKWLSGLVFSLGYLWILFDGDHQGWHDKLVASVVRDG